MNTSTVISRQRGPSFCLIAFPQSVSVVLAVWMNSRLRAVPAKVANIGFPRDGNSRVMMAALTSAPKV